MEKKFQTLSKVDRLTRLLNRTAIRMQIDLMIKEGILIQGYYYYKPMNI